MDKENTPTTNPPNQFKYISLWNDYINLLKINVPLKRHRLGLKYYENTFTGSEAIQTLMNVVKSRPDLFPENTNSTAINDVSL